MAVEVAGVTTVFEATDAQFLAELRRIDRGIQNTRTRGQRELRQLDQGWKSVVLGANGFAGALTRLLPAISIAAGAAGLGRLVTSSARFADELVDVSNKVGVTTSELQELRFAASEAGVNARTLDLAMQRFARRVGEAAQGGGELKDTLIDYNIAVRDSTGATRSQIDILRDLAEAIKGAESQQEALRIAFKAFDSEGAALVNILRDGEAGLDAFLAKARELGVVVDEDAIKALDEAADAVRRLNESLNRQSTQVIGDVVLFFERLRNVVQAGQLGEAIARIFRDGLEEGRGFADTLREVNDELDRFRNAARLPDPTFPDFEVPRPAPTGGTFEGVSAEGLPGSEFANKFVRERAAQEREIAEVLEEQRSTLRDSAFVAVASGAAARDRALFEREIAETVQSREAVLRQEAGDIQASVRETEASREAWQGNVTEIASNQEAVEKLADAAEGFGQQVGDAFADMIIQGESFRDVVRGLLSDLARQGLRSGIGALFRIGAESLFRSAGGGQLGAGQASVVGELGPEIFVPNTSGRVLPNNAFGGGGSVINNIDARGTNMTVIARLERAVQELNRSIETRAIAAVTTERARDPGLLAT